MLKSVPKAATPTPPLTMKTLSASIVFIRFGRGWDICFPFRMDCLGGWCFCEFSPGLE